MWHRSEGVARWLVTMGLAAKGWGVAWWLRVRRLVATLLAARRLAVKHLTGW